MNPNATAILAQALATIKASFWVKGEEIAVQYPHQGRWEGAAKSIDLKLNQLTGGQYAHPGAVEVDGVALKIVGVCSIGAMALANSTLYGKPLNTWYNFIRMDKASYLAGAALVMAVYEANAKRGEYNHARAHTGVIADWNDKSDREKKEILAVFRAALKSPLLTARNVWGVGSVDKYSALVFPTKMAAKEFLAGNSKLKRVIEFEYGSTANWKPVKYPLS